MGVGSVAPGLIRQRDAQAIAETTRGMKEREWDVSHSGEPSVSEMIQESRSVAKQAYQYARGSSSADAAAESGEGAPVGKDVLGTPVRGGGRSSYAVTK